MRDNDNGRTETKSDTRDGIIGIIAYVGVGFLCLIWSMGSTINWNDAWTYAIVGFWPGFLVVWFFQWVASIIGLILIGLVMIAAIVLACAYGGQIMERLRGRG